MKGWASKFHTTRRRLKQGLLERVGAAESSVDTKRDERQWARFHSLESSLHAVNDALRQHLTSLVVSACPALVHCGWLIVGDHLTVLVRRVCVKREVSVVYSCVALCNGALPPGTVFQTSVCVARRSSSVCTHASRASCARRCIESTQTRFVIFSC